MIKALCCRGAALLLTVMLIGASSCEKEEDRLRDRAVVTGLLNGKPWSARGEFAEVDGCDWLYLRFTVRSKELFDRQTVSIFFPDPSIRNYELFKYYPDGPASDICGSFSPDSANASLFRIAEDGDVITGFYFIFDSEKFKNELSVTRFDREQNTLEASMRAAFAIETPGFPDPALPDTVYLEIDHFKVSSH